ncbi:MAG: tRNA (adenosine(37)-N6)-threonylcarbamoyltransferase complex transferase subunit TsaD [Polyangiaceae bacterium UTPRO1]|jgi:N6-L-threonylcarbamoyladenine synthase|nr:tRNA (adenosine(37)-N6)-threonylcarbamoyltransferase complex transferase subunit TsaD [Myxococcales bacterium]OQY65654.1 MAG: tRNA (adenosine(37)-N6)-threonylcarbamoyltransferase complex transferase subunit TsaD [Polyangiaceae bacterium UTPRO1]
MRVLAIETSCDDTAAAVLDECGVRASIVASQDMVHGKYGGIVPELASRQHMVTIIPVIERALAAAGVGLDAIAGVAATHGPGLVGSLLVGLQVAKGIAFERRLPFIGVNHLEGHLLAILIDRQVAFPYLGLLVSGGHTSLYLVEGVGRYRQLGRTRDDAAGEAFDKGAKMLGLGFPGGREIDRLGAGGDRTAIRFPRASLKRGAYDFSFSGVKTALRQYLVDGLAHSLEDVCASFQEAIVDMLIAPTLRAAAALGATTIVVSGGVSANRRLRTAMTEAGGAAGCAVAFPRLAYCTDNAAMIGYAGRARLLRGERHDLTLNAAATLPIGV